MRTSLCLAAILFGAVGVARAASPPDSWITAKIKLALLTGDSIISSAVHVDTLDGVVTIHGTVRTQADRTRAGKAARAVTGVRQVRDLLQVVPSSKEKAVGVSDLRIAEGVSKGLREERSLEDSRIKVKSVDKGAVLLMGKSDSMGDHVLAVQCAHAVPGVRRVFSEIQGPRGTLDWKEQQGSRHDDSYLTAITKLRLMADPRVSVFDVNVDTDHGVVTLFGAVPSRAARSAAEADAREVEGVSRVRNEIEVASYSRRELIKANDGEIRSSVEAALKQRAIEHIGVAVGSGVVRLTGTVPTIWERLEAATVAHSVEGVRAVNDDLRVGK